MRTTSAPADNGTEDHVKVGPEGYVDEEYSGNYGPEGVGDYSGDYGPEFSGSLGPETIGDYSGDYGAEFSGSLGPETIGDYSGDYGPEGVGDYSGDGDYVPEGIGDPCEDTGPDRDTEYCGVYGPEGLGDYGTEGVVEYYEDNCGPENAESGCREKAHWHSPTFLTPVVYLIVAVQLSVVVFLLVRGRKEKTFRQGFYLFFVAVTLLEAFIVLVRRDIYSDSGYATVFGLPYNLGWPITRVVDVIVFIFVAPIIAYAQSLLHLAIVTTRFTAFCFPLAHSSVWSSRNVLAVLVVIAALSIPLGVGPPAFYAIRKMTANCSYDPYRQLVYSEDWICGFDEEDQDIEWQRYSVALFNAANLLVSTACYLVSFFLNMCSVTMLLVLRATRRLQRNHQGPELRLFAHSLVVFLLQTVMVFQTFIHSTDEGEVIILEWFPDFPHSAEWLAGRNVSGDPYGIAECRYWNGCGLFYGILSGYWMFDIDPKRILVDHLETAAGNLTPCVFALCGPVSLLAISGNVRNGYFRFYLKCLRWRQKRTHVIQVVSSSVVLSSGATPSKASYRANFRRSRLVV